MDAATQRRFQQCQLTIPFRTDVQELGSDQLAAGAIWIAARRRGKQSVTNVGSMVSMATSLTFSRKLVKSTPRQSATPGARLLKRNQFAAVARRQRHQGHALLLWRISGPRRAEGSNPTTTRAHVPTAALVAARRFPALESTTGCLTSARTL